MAFRRRRSVRRRGFRSYRRGRRRSGVRRIRIGYRL
ncbi:hypothetical protein [Flyfo microvirus Tbat2_151]|nr:hypothetical protein [Flyfo microvirus Tbat2_151]